MSAVAERWREARDIYGRADLPKVVKAGDALAAALEAERRRNAELEAGLREMYGPLYDAWVVARDLLAGRAAGGEG